MGRSLVATALCATRRAALVGLVLLAVYAPAPAFGVAPSVQIIDATGDGTHSLDYPWAVDADPAGNAYVAGLVSSNVFQISPAGAVTQILSASGDGVHSLSYPYSLAVGPTGSVYVAGAFSHNVFRITPAGAVTQILDATGDGVHGLVNPTSVAVGPDGSVYVAGSASDNVFRITSAGAVTQILDAAGDGVHALDLPTAVAVAPDGRVFVLGQNSVNVFEITPAGAVTQVLDASGDGTTALFNPVSLAAGRDGSVYVGFGGAFFRVAASGITVHDVPIASGGSFPVTVEVDAADNVYAIGSYQAFKITPGGTIQVILDESGDGTHPFADAADVAVAPNGRAYVAAQSTHNVFAVDVGQVVPGTGWSQSWGEMLWGGGAVLPALGPGALALLALALAGGALAAVRGSRSSH